MFVAKSWLVSCQNRRKQSEPTTIFAINLRTSPIYTLLDYLSHCMAASRAVMRHVGSTNIINHNHTFLSSFCMPMSLRKRYCNHKPLKQLPEPLFVPKLATKSSFTSTDDRVFHKSNGIKNHHTSLKAIIGLNLQS